MNRKSRTNRPYTISPGNWPPIITLSEAEAIIVERQRRNTARKSISKVYTFSGVIFCDRCQTSMNYTGIGIGYPAVRCSYFHEYKKHKDGMTKGENISIKKVRQAISNGIAFLQNEVTRAQVLSEYNMQADSGTQDKIDVIDLELKQLMTKAERIHYDYYIASKLSDSQHDSLMLNITNRQKDLGQQRSKLYAQLIQEKAKSNISSTLDDLATDGLYMLDNPDFRQANVWFRKRIRVLIRDAKIFGIEYMSTE